MFRSGSREWTCARRRIGTGRSPVGERDIRSEERLILPLFAIHFDPASLRFDPLCGRVAAIYRRLCRSRGRGRLHVSAKSESLFGLGELRLFEGKFPSLLVNARSILLDAASIWLDRGNGRLRRWHGFGFWRPVPGEKDDQHHDQRNAAQEQALRIFWQEARDL